MTGAVRITIEYSVAGMRDQVVVLSDKAEIKDLLTHLRIDEALKGSYLGGGGGKCFILFHLEDGTVIKTNFIAPDHLDRWHWGQVYLKDEGFYYKVCEIASKASGKRIDVLDGN